MTSASKILGGEASQALNLAPVSYDWLVQLGASLHARGLRVVTAESCTGGGIAVALSEVPGSSFWLEAGFVTYSNASKQALLGVPAPLLTQQGAVSEAVVCAMTAGALARTEANLAVAVSGIAGPQGATPGKPVGTVCLAWQQRGQVARAITHHLAGGRQAVRAATVRLALEGLLV